jgi:hypothetical protein
MAGGLRAWLRGAVNTAPPGAELAGPMPLPAVAGVWSSRIPAIQAGPAARPAGGVRLGAASRESISAEHDAGAPCGPPCLVLV